MLIEANSVYPDETTRNEQTYQDIHYLPFCSWILTDTPTFNRGFVQIQRQKSPLRKLRDEQVNLTVLVSTDLFAFKMLTISTVIV